MLVCHCRGITDRQIRNLVREGATSAREIAQATGAGMRCGGCRTNVKKVVNDTLSREHQKTATSAMPNEVLLPMV